MLVREFAKEVHVSVELLLRQLVDAGVNVTSENDTINDADKSSLLDYLRKKHKGKVVLVRRSGSPHRTVTGRRKRVLLVKRANTRDKRNAEALAVEMAATDALSGYYAALDIDELQKLWNSGKNELEEPDRTLVRIALRNKLGVR